SYRERSRTGWAAPSHGLRPPGRLHAAESAACGLSRPRLHLGGPVGPWDTGAGTVAEAARCREKRTGTLHPLHRVLLSHLPSRRRSLSPQGPAPLSVWTRTAPVTGRPLAGAAGRPHEPQERWPAGHRSALA